MKIYFLRHGAADWPDWNKLDDDRPLTASSREEMERVGKFLRALAPQISLVLSSPLPRARQTAEIAARHLRVELREEPALGHEFSGDKLRALLRREGEADLMLVGHEPGLSNVIRELTGGRVKLTKGGVAAIDLTEAEEGRLLWLVPPKIAKLRVESD